MVPAVPCSWDGLKVFTVPSPIDACRPAAENGAGLVVVLWIAPFRMLAVL